MTKAALSFGGWVKWRRRGLGLTQKELADRAGYAVVTLRKVEADELRPSGQMARKLAEALELDQDSQAQFVRFARDEAHWDDITLPGRAMPALIPPASVAPAPQAEEAAPYRNSEEEQPGLATIIRLSSRHPARTRPIHNLPAQTTPLIGREHELAELEHLLANPENRLVTILSTGGMGKSHLAVVAALQQVERFADGVCWVALAPLTDAKELVLAIAAALGLQLQRQRTPEQQVGDFLHAKQLLLVLDNFEHLLEGAPIVGDLLTRAPQLSVLITSRQRLKLSSETVVFLDGLRFPAEQSGDALDYPAVQLFLLHARRMRPAYQPNASDIAGMVAVCRQVHGMPLGILLAAAWSRVISPAEIAAEIDRDLSFLQADMPDIPARQRNLRMVFLHTWSRLSTAERQVFMHLSVFRGGATAEAARHITGATVDVLAALIDRALLRRLSNGRYEIHELLRQFAAEQLAAHDTAHAGQQKEAQWLHSRYYLSLLGQAEQRLRSAQQRAALDSIRADFENISIAWHWAVQAREFALLVPALHALFVYCEVRGNLSVGLMLFAAAAAEMDAELAVSVDDQQTLQVLRGRVIVRLGACEILLSNYGRGELLLLDGLPHILEDWERAFTLVYLGQAASERGELALARTRLDESLALSRQCNDFAVMAQAFQILEVGRPIAEAQRLAAESLALARKAGRPDLIATRLNQLGWHTWCLGDYALADACWQKGIALCDELDLQGENAWPLDCLGVAAWAQGDMTAAEHYIEAALAIYTEVGRQSHMGMCMAELALVLASMGRVQQAIALARQAVAITRGIDGQMMLIVSLNYLGAALLAAGELVEARRTLLEAIQRAWDYQFLFSVMIGFYYFAELLALESRHTEPASALAHKSLAVTLLSCVRTDTATWQIFKDKAAELQAQIEGALAAEVLGAALLEEENRTVKELVSIVLGATTASGAVTPAPKCSPTPGAQASEVLVEPLTVREFAVLHLIAAGRSNQDVAAELIITPGTAKWYVSQILAKLGVHSRTQAVARARELGLLA